MLDMIFRIQTLVLFFTAVSLSQAQYFYPYSRQESAVSLNNAPVGIYGRSSNMYGGSEEYGVSLGGAPVGIYGRRRQMNQSPSYFAPSLWDYWSMMYALECYRNGYLYDFPYATPLTKPVKDSRVPSASPRGFKGSISVASSSADAVREKTTAEAVSMQGNISPNVILDLLDL